ncbi:hypothetical protein GCK72_013064 [Caenorhabditis remanei]|uniref:HAT C-terminal dimerisation domain-containing protein n=1 Tax=Caenorhabditis remanei TaxID=31234 RepID=A0A6A5GPL5_CAERE|nr:hypothetical protein GCK72_013064 [Caenorhabditis remanei]KAF1756611.1 hypothetical protein GCK72_013064 [Caenorhabditis remanei]
MISHINSCHSEELKNMEKQKKSKNVMSFNNRKEEHAEADRNLVLAICTSTVPFRFAKNQYFIKFCGSLDKQYEVMSPDKLRRRIHENSKLYIQKTKSDLENVERFFLTVDGWDGKFENVNLYAIFVYYIDEKFEQKKVFLGIRHVAGKATSVNVGNVVTDVLEDYGVDSSKLIGAICDAGSNLRSFLNKNMLYHLHCAAHVLALILKEVSEVPSVTLILKKVYSLASHLSRSKVDRSIFRQRSTALKTFGPIPLPFSPTRWGGCAILAASFLNHYQSIFSLSKFQEYLLSEEEKVKLEYFVELTSPFVDAVSEAEKDNNFCSEIIPQFANLLEFVSSHNQMKHIVRVITNETQKRFDAYMSNDIALISTFIDPRFGYFDGIMHNRKWQEIEETVIDYCDSLKILNSNGSLNSDGSPQKRSKVSQSGLSRFMEAKSLSSSMDDTKAEVVAYEAYIRKSRPPYSSSPLDFWKCNEFQFPKLARLARHILCVPQSSAAVERLFSRCGEIVSSSRRNRLSSQTMHEILINASLGILKEKETEYIECDDDDDETEQNGEQIKLDLLPLCTCNPSNDSRRSRSTPTRRRSIQY